MSIDEYSDNCSYLIERISNEAENNLCYLKKITYRKNLLLEFKKLFKTEFAEFTEQNIQNNNNFRKFISMAEDKGYLIYQLTRL